MVHREFKPGPILVIQTFLGQHQMYDALGYSEAIVGPSDDGDDSLLF
jgi:hypothetical protein